MSSHIHIYFIMLHIYEQAEMWKEGGKNENYYDDDFTLHVAWNYLL